MIGNALLVESAKVVWAAAPLDITGAGFNGDWVDLKTFRKVAVVLLTGAWAGGTAAVTLEQATDVSGTSGKALSFAYQYVSTGLTSDSPTKTAVTSNTFNLSVAVTSHVIEVLASDLDIANGFDCLRVDSLLMANAVGIVQYVLHGPRHASPIAIAAITD